MGLDAIRDRARAQVHSHFSLPAVVRPPEGSSEVPVPVHARLHRNVRKPIGDLDREGFALVIEQSNGIIIDREEWEPKKHWIIDFGRDRVFSLDTLDNDKGERYVRMQVSYER